MDKKKVVRDIHGNISCAIFAMYEAASDARNLGDPVLFEKIESLIGGTKEIATYINRKLEVNR